VEEGYSEVEMFVALALLVRVGAGGELILLVSKSSP